MSLPALALAALLLAAAPAGAIVTHPDANEPAVRPSDLVMGRINDNASCVVVGNQWVITTRHEMGWGTGMGSTVTVGGVTYQVGDVYTMTEPNVPDLLVIRVAGANFTDYVRLNTTSNEMNATVVIGGFGRGRGETLYYKNDPNIPFGYAWDPNATNTVLRWGANRFDGSPTFGITSPFGYCTNLLVTDFDGPTLSGVGLDGEAALSEFDSGAGAFRNIGGAWYVVGLGWGTEHAGVAANWWDDPNAPGTNPERNYFVRISSYAAWIQSVIPTNAVVASGNWSSASTWSGGEPNAAIKANISNGGTITIDQAGERTPELTLAFSPGQTGRVNQTGGTLRSGVAYVGYQGSGTYAQSAGTHAVDGNLYLGAAAGASGTYSLSDGNLTVGGSEYVGDAGAGRFDQAGGRHTIAGTLYVGRAADANASYTLSGGQLVVPTVSVGALGALTLAGGTLRGDPLDGTVVTEMDSAGLVHVSSGSYTVGRLASPGAGPLAGSLRVDAGASLSVSRAVQRDATVGGTLTLRGSTGRTTSVLGSLTIAGSMDAWTGTLDIAGNYLVIQGGNLAAVENQVKSGLNLAGGYWNGKGITSSAAAADTNCYTAVGVLDNSLAHYATFGSAGGLTGSEILVRHTFYGDADLNGVVDFDTDYILWQEGFLNGYSGWVYGDFNHDGVVDFDNDYILWQTVFLNQPALPGAAAEDGGLGDSSGATSGGAPGAFLYEFVDGGGAATGGTVPEPATLLVLAAGAALLRPRRRG